MRKICLVMIVKNEAHVLARCLDSVRPFLDSYVICDTGSTDDTIKVAHQALWGVPGTVYEDPWVDFGHNRTLSLQRGRELGADYLLHLDADEVFHLDDAFCLEDLDADSYLLRTLNGPFSYAQQRLLKASLPWRYEGVMHEHLLCEQAGGAAMLPGAHLTTPGDGARSQDPNKLHKDIAIMQGVLAEHPEDARTWFHLGLSQRLAGLLEDAIKTFERRYGMEHGMDYERWYSGYMLGHLYSETGRSELVEQMWLESYANYPQTAEPLHWLGRFYLDRGEPERALPLLELAASKPLPVNLFVREDQVYDWEAKSYLAKCLVALDRPGDANLILGELVTSGHLPDGVLTEETVQYLAALNPSKVA